MTEPEWTRNCDSGTCIETRDVGDVVEVRDSGQPGVVLRVPKVAWEEFLAGVRREGGTSHEEQSHLHRFRGKVVGCYTAPGSSVCEHPEDGRVVRTVTDFTDGGRYIGPWREDS